jgi:hypothetical protein
MQGCGSQYGIENGRKEGEYRRRTSVPVGRPSDAGFCRSSYVSMMQATDFGNLHDLAHVRWLDGPSIRRILLERKVSSCAVVVREVTGQDAAQVPFAQHEKASSAGESHPRALPEPYVSLSTHTAPINQPSASPLGAASERTASADAGRVAPANAPPAGDAP